MRADVDTFRSAVRQYTRDALAQLQSEKEAPTFALTVSALGPSWVRGDGEIWKPNTAVAPVGIDINRLAVESLERVRAAVANNPWLTDHFASVVGTIFDRSALRLEAVLDMCILEPMIVATNGFTFGEELFDRVFAPLGAFLEAETLERIEFVPILGLEPPTRPIQLDSDLELRQQTDSEISFCLDMGILHGQPMMTSGYRILTSSSQTCLARSANVTKVFGKYTPTEEDIAAELARPNLDDLASAVVLAVRLIAEGAVGAGPSVRLSSEMLGFSRGGAFTTTWAQRPDTAPTAAIRAPQLPAFLDLWRAARSPGVKGDKTLAIVSHRLIEAALRTSPVDAIIDLMIAAEALFLEGPPSERGELRFRLALNAALFIEHADRNAVRRFFRGAYDARSAIVHGSEPEHPRALDGSTATVEALVGDLDRLMRSAVTKAVQLRSATPHGRLIDFERSLAALLNPQPEPKEPD